MISHRKRILGLPFDNIWAQSPEDDELEVESLVQAAEPRQGLHLLSRTFDILEGKERGCDKTGGEHWGIHMSYQLPEYELPHKPSSSSKE